VGQFEVGDKNGWNWSMILAAFIISIIAVAEKYEIVLQK